MYIHIYLYIYKNTHTHVWVYLCVCIYAHTHTYCMWSTWMRFQGSKNMFIRIHIYDYIHICTYIHIFRVVPCRISNLDRKRGQYQDYGFVRVKRQRNVPSKRRYLRSVWKEACTGCGFVTFVTFLRFFDVLGFAKKTSKNTERVTKT